jgi:hypothetical protein
MKWWVWVLLLVNVGLFAYFNANAPKTEVANKEISPEKLKVLSAKDLEAMPKKVAPLPEAAPEQLAVSQAATCYKWGNFTSTNLPSAQQQDKRFWVYYPPLKNTELARQKAEEIKALGVEELYIVQDSQWRNAISFGLFSDEQLASSLLTSLQEKGVKGATKALRSPGKSLSSLLIKAVTSDAALELHKIKPEFVGTDLAPTACP